MPGARQQALKGSDAMQQGRRRVFGWKEKVIVYLKLELWPMGLPEVLEAEDKLQEHWDILATLEKEPLQKKNQADWMTLNRKWDSGLDGMGKICKQI